VLLSQRKTKLRSPLVKLQLAKLQAISTHPDSEAKL